MVRDIENKTGLFLLHFFTLSFSCNENEMKSPVLGRDNPLLEIVPSTPAVDLLAIDALGRVPQDGFSADNSVEAHAIPEQNRKNSTVYNVEEEEGPCKKYKSTPITSSVILGEFDKHQHKEKGSEKDEENKKSEIEADEILLKNLLSKIKSLCNEVTSCKNEVLERSKLYKNDIQRLTENKKAERCLDGQSTEWRKQNLEQIGKSKALFLGKNKKTSAHLQENLKAINNQETKAIKALNKAEQIVGKDQGKEIQKKIKDMRSNVEFIQKKVIEMGLPL